MHRFNLVSCVLVGLVIATLVPHASAQGVGCSPASCVQVRNVSAPTAVSVGQQFTVNVSVAYALYVINGQSLVVAILNGSSPSGSWFPTVGPRPAPCNSYSPQGESLCYVQLGTNAMEQGDLTVSFALAGLSQSGFTSLYAYGVVTQITPGGSGQVTSDVKTVTVNVTPTPIPEVTSPLLLLSLAFIATVCMLRRKQSAIE